MPHRKLYELIKGDISEWILSAVLGAGFSMLILKTFILGFVGALGGLFAKVLWNLVMYGNIKKPKKP